MQPADESGDLQARIQQLEAEVKLKTNQLIASTSRAYSFLDSLNIGFIMCDVHAEVVLTNQPVQRILATKTENSINEWSVDIIDQLFQPDLNFKQLIMQCLHNNQPLQNKSVNFGQRALHIYVAPMLSEGSAGESQLLGAVVLVEDITEQKVAERSRDEFFSIASHELRTPLTAIRGNTSLIQKYYGDRLPDKDVAEMIDDIHTSSVRLIEIVNDFLDVSALEQGKISLNPEEFPIQVVVAEVLRELQSLGETKGLNLQADPSVATAPSAMADRTRIKQVLYNLIGNAIKFTEHGSITLSAEADDHFVTVTVTDTGPGIPLDRQNLLFRKFQQAGGDLLTRDSTTGTGLGLYISKLIVEQSGGWIRLQWSEIGRGTAFAFSLPRPKS